MTRLTIGTALLMITAVTLALVGLSVARKHRSADGDRLSRGDTMTARVTLSAEQLASKPLSRVLERDVRSDLRS